MTHRIHTVIVCATPTNLVNALAVLETIGSVRGSRGRGLCVILIGTHIADYSREEHLFEVVKQIGQILIPQARFVLIPNFASYKPRLIKRILLKAIPELLPCSVKTALFQNPSRTEVAFFMQYFASASLIAYGDAWGCFADVDFQTVAATQINERSLSCKFYSFLNESELLSTCSGQNVQSVCYLDFQQCIKMLTAIRPLYSLWFTKCLPEISNRRATIVLLSSYAHSGMMFDKKNQNFGHPHLSINRLTSVDKIFFARRELAKYLPMSIRKFLSYLRSLRAKRFAKLEEDYYVEQIRRHVDPGSVVVLKRHPGEGVLCLENIEALLSEHGYQVLRFPREIEDAPIEPLLFGDLVPDIFFGPSFAAQAKTAAARVAARNSPRTRNYS